jgi:hypothetical protein
MPSITISPIAAENESPSVATSWNATIALIPSPGAIA